MLQEERPRRLRGGLFCLTTRRLFAVAIVGFVVACGDSRKPEVSTQGAALSSPTDVAPPSDASAVSDAAPDPADARISTGNDQRSDAGAIDFLPGHAAEPTTVAVTEPATPSTDDTIKTWTAQANTVGVVTCTGATYQQVPWPPYVTTTFALKSQQDLKGAVPLAIIVPGGVLPDGSIVFNGEQPPLEIGKSYLIFVGHAAFGDTPLFTAVMTDVGHAWVFDRSYTVDQIVKLVEGTP